MLRDGHLGISLLLFAPIGFVMLGFAPLELIVIAGVATLAGAGTPDLDTKTSLVKHRGFTHTIWFSLLYGVAVAGFTFVSPDVFGFSNFQSFGRPSDLGWVLRGLRCSYSSGWRRDHTERYQTIRPGHATRGPPRSGL